MPEPGIRHPLETGSARGKAEPPTLETADELAEKALKDLLGRKAVAAFLNITGFARGFVATVDSLDTPFGSPHLWPVKSMAGRFEVEPADAGSVIATKNFERYEPLLRTLLAMDTRKAVRLYVRFYPVLQQAYEELGYPGKYFNDRVVEVIDHLLAAPAPVGPLAVKRMVVGDRPSNIYEFEDLELEKATVGEKILFRVGPENAAKIKAKLTAVRAQIADGARLR